MKKLLSTEVAEIAVVRPEGDSRFRVIGTKGLRIVDASVFPRIPGFFIVTPIYMISEKATDVIVEDAQQSANRSDLRATPGDLHETRDRR